MQLDSLYQSGLTRPLATFHIPAVRAAHEEQRQALEGLLAHPLASDAYFASDGSLLVVYPAGSLPTALRIPLRIGQRLGMIAAATRSLDRKLERMQDDA